MTLDSSDIFRLEFGVRCELFSRIAITNITRSYQLWWVNPLLLISEFTAVTKIF